MKKLDKERQLKEEKLAADRAKNDITDKGKKGKSRSMQPSSYSKKKKNSLAAMDEEAEAPPPIKVRQAKFSNDPKITRKIKVGMPIFKREVRMDTVRAGYTELLNKLNESELTIRRIKNGQTIFD